MLSYYSNLVKKLGGRINGRFEFAICFITSLGEKHGITIVSPRVFTSKVSNSRIPGYPLESIQIDPTSGKYISEMSEKERATFRQEVIGKKLIPFIKSVTF